MKLSYYDLISTSPYFLDGVGHIRAVTFRDIDKLPQKITTYNIYISVISFDKDAFIKATEMSTEQVDLFNKFFKERNLKTTVFDFILSNELVRNQLFLALDFFFVENIAYNQENGTFILFNGEFSEESKVGLITRDNFKDVADVILQRCAKEDDEEENYDDMVFRDEKTRRKWIKQHEGAKQRKLAKQKQNGEMYDIGNIISAVCAQGIGITMLNVWDLTVYNLYDQFNRIGSNRIDQITRHNIAVWGDEKKQYDYEGWLKNNVTK